AGLPPQARVLQKSTGGQIVVGEKADRFFLILTLNTKDSEATGQIQQVLQGLVALAVLNEDKNKDLARFAQAVKVSTNDTLVTVALDLPISNVLAQVEAELKKRSR